MPTLPKIHNPRATKKRTVAAQKKARSDRRMYATNDTTWRKFRAEQLRREPLCRICTSAGRIVSGGVVDHIDADTYNNSPANLQTLCKACHDKKTASETGFGSAYAKVRYQAQ